MARAVVFAATLGVEIDRLIAKYGRLPPTKAVLLQAIGAEIGGTTRRFSPGYGDLPLDIQPTLFRLLKAAAPWCRTVVGGAVLTRAYADRIGADKYTKDAMETVRYAQTVTDGSL